ncbi:MAG: hypothetical protein ACXVH1_29930 [Solirubrobacteraceae bacterium]
MCCDPASNIHLTAINVVAGPPRLMGGVVDKDRSYWAYYQSPAGDWWFTENPVVRSENLRVRRLGRKTGRIRSTERLLEILAPEEIRGPDEQEPEQGFRRFVYKVTVLHTSWRRVTVNVDAAAWNEPGTASLPSPLRENVETLGRAALEEQLEHNKYPRRIFVDRSGVRTEGQQVVFETVRWLVGIAIGAAVGYGWTRIFGGEAALGSLLGALVFGLVQWGGLPLIVQPRRSEFDQLPI